MHMGVQLLSVPRNWGAEALQDSEATGLMLVFCRGNQSMGIERTLVTFGHYRIEPWREVWVGLFFFLSTSWQRRVTGCMPAVPQLDKVSTSKPSPYWTETGIQQLPKTSGSPAAAAAAAQSFHGYEKNIWSFCSSLSFSWLNWAMYLFAGHRHWWF